MAKLPGIDYNRPVQRLGRHDVQGPIRVANAQVHAALQVSEAMRNVADVIETNDIAERTAKFSNEMAELNAQVKNRKAYDSGELTSLGIEHQSTNKVQAPWLEGSYDPNADDGYTEQERDVIPAHEVAVDYYEKRANQIYAAHSDGLSPRGQKVMNKIWTSKFSAGIAAVTEQSIKYANQYAQAQAELNFEDAVNAGSLEGAVVIAETARANQTWDPIYYASKIGPLEGRVTERNYLNELDNIDDPGELESVQALVLNDDRMTSAQMSGLNKMIETKIQRQNRRIEKEIKEQKEESSSQLLSTLAAELTLDEIDFTFPQEVMLAVQSLTPSDRKAAISIWRAERNKVGTSDQEMLKQAHLLVRSTIIPDEMGESSFLQRRETAREMVTDMLSNGDIAVKDYIVLLDDLNTIRNMPFKSPEYKMVEEDIYITFTGSTKNFMDSIMPDGRYAVGLADTMYELNNAALEEGPGFDARQWWEVKKPEVTTRAHEDNQKLWDESTAAETAVTGSDGKIDFEKTVENLDEMVVNGEISKDEADKRISETEWQINEDERWRRIKQNIVEAAKQ